MRSPRTRPHCPATTTPAEETSCPEFRSLLELADRRWVGEILRAAAIGAERFAEYRSAIDGISDRMLVLRLKELEREGLMERTVIPSTPVQVRYRLSADGRALVDALRPLGEWSARRSAQGADRGDRG